MKRRGGFTLIELLVVIAIIAMLLAILTPSLNKGREKAREVICRAHLKGLGLGIVAYLDQNDNRSFDYNGQANRFQWYQDTDSTRYISPYDNDAYWGVAYVDYIEDPSVFGCPSYRRVDALIYNQPTILIRQAAFSLNGHFRDRNVSEIRSPSCFIVTHDHVEPRVEQGSNDMFHNDGLGTMNLRHYRQGGHRQAHYRGIFRHSIKSDKPFETQGRANVLWLDGHVDFLDETTGDNVRQSWYTGN